MTHERDALWSYAAGDLSPDAAARVRAHLELCVDCAFALAEVKEAQGVLSPPPVPDLSPARWRAVDAQVLEAAKAELARSRWRVALKDLFGGIPGPAWAGALVAAGIAAAVLFWPKPHPSLPEPLAKAPVPAPAPLAPAPAVSPPVPAPAPVEAPRQVLVASAKRARAGERSLQARALVSEGAQVATEKQGELWLSLPDGSRAALLASSAVRLAHASEDTVDLQVEKGTLLVAAAHRSERPFAVHAGEVEVRVVGTRFLVARDEAGVDVAVEEGAVEAGPAGHTQRIAAGQRVRFENGRAKRGGIDRGERVELARLEPPTRPTPRPAVAPAPGPALTDETPAIPEGAPEVAAAEPAPAPVAPMAPVEPAVDSGDTDWNTPPPSIAQAPSPVADAGRMRPSASALPNAAWPPIQNTATPVNSTPDEHWIRQTEKLADQGLCERALQRCDQWLTTTGAKADPAVRRRVLTTKARCLRKLGRAEEAAEVDRLR